MKSIRFLLIILFFCVFSVLKAQILSKNAQISLLTYEPIDEIHAIFGHSAFRVSDPEKHIDWVYNYGTFDFDTPNFLMKFIRGKLPYSLGIQDFRQLLGYYEYRNQTVSEQVINLDSTEKQAVFDFLQNNYRPENRYYLYDFFYDNCATRMRDVIGVVLGESLTYDTATVIQNKTFRQLTDEYVAEKPWIDFGIDLILGTPADRKADFSLQMFLPRYLSKGFEKGIIETKDEKKPLIVSTRTVFKAEEVKEKPSFFTTPLFLFSIIFSLILGLNIFKKENKVTKITNNLFLFLIGIAGLIMTFTWFGTDHITTKNNLNILWAFPLHIFAAFGLRKPAVAFWYFAITTALNIALLLFWFVLPQQLHVAFIPIIMTLIVIGFFKIKK